MKSFGLWYKKKEEKRVSQAHVGLGRNNLRKKIISKDKSKVIEPQFSLHVNFWSLEDIKTKDNIKTPLLDVGLKIKNYDKLSSVTFYCPFDLDENLVVDLSSKLASKNNANIIFNSDCEIQTKDSYTIVELSEHEENLLVFPLKQVIKNVYQIKKDSNKKSQGTQIIFNFEKFHEYVKGVEKLKELDTIYIRFRIKDSALKEQIYFDSEPLNKSFESAFSGTRIIDFKVNEKRNIDEDVRAEIIVSNQKWVAFNDIHFLVMVPSSYDLTSFYEKTMTCRELEKDLWDDYLDTHIDFSSGHVLAYHWKDKKSKDSKCEDFACLVKVNYSRAKKSTILLYMLGVITLGIISSVLVTGLAKWHEPNTACFWWIGLGVSAVLICFLCGLPKKILDFFKNYCKKNSKVV